MFARSGDMVAGAGTMLGPFNVDRQRAIASRRRLRAMDVDVAPFGHADPLLAQAARHLAHCRLDVP